MSTIPEPANPGFPNVYEIQDDDDVKGGPDGISNRQAKELVERTAYINKNKIDKSEKGAANGIATLDENKKVPLSQMLDAILGQMLYAGSFNAATAVATLSANGKAKLGTSSNTITLTNNTTAITGYKANQGCYYLVSAPGTFAGKAYDDGDWLIATDSGWGKIDNTDAVTSVAGRIGAILLNLSDIGASDVTIGAEESTEKFGAGSISQGLTTWLQQIGRKINGAMSALSGKDPGTKTAITVTSGTVGHIIKTSITNANVGTLRLSFKGSNTDGTANVLYDTDVACYINKTSITSGYFHQINKGAPMEQCIGFIDTDNTWSFFLGHDTRYIRVDAAATFVSHTAYNTASAFSENALDNVVTGITAETVRPAETLTGFRQVVKTSMRSIVMTQGRNAASRTVYIATEDGDDTFLGVTRATGSKTVASALQQVARGSNVTIQINKYKAPAYKSGTTAIAAYSSSTAYTVGNLVTYVGYVWKRVTAGTGTTPAFTAAAMAVWEFVNLAAASKGSYSDTETYALGDTVLYTDSVTGKELSYICLAANTTGIAPVAETTWAGTDCWSPCGEYNPVLTEASITASYFHRLTITNGDADLKIIFLNGLTVTDTGRFYATLPLLINGALTGHYMASGYLTGTLQAGAIAVNSGGSWRCAGTVRVRSYIGHSAQAIAHYSGSLTVRKTDTAARVGISVTQGTYLSLNGAVTIAGFEGANTGAGINVVTEAKVTTYGNITISGFKYQILVGGTTDGSTLSTGTFECNSAAVALSKGDGNTTATVNAIKMFARSFFFASKGCVITRNDGIADSIDANGSFIDYGLQNKISFGTCSTAAATAAKTSNITGFARTTGCIAGITFEQANTKATPTLNVNGTGAANIRYNNANITADMAVMMPANTLLFFQFDGYYWNLLNPPNVNGVLKLPSANIDDAAMEMITSARTDLSRIANLQNNNLSWEGNWDFNENTGVLSALRTSGYHNRVISIPVDKSESSSGYVRWVYDGIWPAITGLGTTPNIAGGQNITIPNYTMIIGRHTRGGSVDAVTLYALVYTQTNASQLLQPGDVVLCMKMADGGSIHPHRLLLGNGQVIGGGIELRGGLLHDAGKVDIERTTRYYSIYVPGSSSNFYPVTFQQGQQRGAYIDICSESRIGTDPFNQNRIRFILDNSGWSDRPGGFTVLSAARFQNEEVTIHSIYAGATYGLNCIYLRGGMTYYVESNVLLTAHEGTASNGSEVYPVNTTGGAPAVQNAYVGWTYEQLDNTLDNAVIGWHPTTGIAGTPSAFAGSDSNGMYAYLKRLSGNHDYIYFPKATQSKDGTMSAEDKKKLDNVLSNTVFYVSACISDNSNVWINVNYIVIAPSGSSYPSWSWPSSVQQIVDQIGVGLRPASGQYHTYPIVAVDGDAAPGYLWVHAGSNFGGINLNVSGFAIKQYRADRIC